MLKREKTPPPPQTCENFPRVDFFFRPKKKRVFIWPPRARRAFSGKSQLREKNKRLSPLAPMHPPLLSPCFLGFVRGGRLPPPPLLLDRREREKQKGEEPTQIGKPAP
eukprot:Hpha_TRINITY_DN15292_c4_g2::TRINITY_DN15292_c4_g2_i1::g.68321::m.68321